MKIIKIENLNYQQQNSFFCPITHAILFEPVFLMCGTAKHLFEKEALENWLLECEQTCPICRHPVTEENQIQPAHEIQLTIIDYIKNKKLSVNDRYMPMQFLLELLTSDPESALQKVRTALINLEYFSDDKELSAPEIKQQILSHALKKQPELLPYFLFQDNLPLTIIKNYLCDTLKAFNEKTINASITKQIGDIKHYFSVAYWLLSDLKGRKILNENEEIRIVLSKNLSCNNLNNFIHSNTHLSTLYYLLATDIGNKILTEIPNHTDRLKVDSLLVKIDHGPHEGKCLNDLYQTIFQNIYPNTVKTLAP